VGKPEYRGMPDSQRQGGPGLTTSTAVYTATAPPRVWHIRIDPSGGLAAILVAPFLWCLTVTAFLTPRALVSDERRGDDALARFPSHVVDALPIRWEILAAESQAR
jgi:hypothetical protein